MMKQFSYRHTKEAELIEIWKKQSCLRLGDIMKLRQRKRDSAIILTGTVRSMLFQEPDSVCFTGAVNAVIGIYLYSALSSRSV